MDLCVVIPAHNEEKRLGEQLEALLRQQWHGNWEIVVVDNKSTDGTAALAAEFSARSPRVRLVSAMQRADKSYAVNLAVSTTQAKAIAFTDADDIVAEGWVAAVVRGLGEHEVVTGANELDLLNPPWLADSRGRSSEELTGTYFNIFPTVRGNNFAVRTSTWNQLGGLAEDMYPCDDLEFSFRCWLNDVKVVGLPDAVVHYRYRASPRILWHQGWNYGSSRPRIAAMLKDAGKPTPPKFAGWKSWILLITTLPRVVTRTGRARWLWIAGNRFGQVAGSIRYRTLML